MQRLARLFDHLQRAGAAIQQGTASPQLAAAVIAAHAVLPGLRQLLEPLHAAATQILSHAVCYHRVRSPSRL